MSVPLIAGYTQFLAVHLRVGCVGIRTTYRTKATHYSCVHSVIWIMSCGLHVPPTRTSESDPDMIRHTCKQTRSFSTGPVVLSDRHLVCGRAAIPSDGESALTLGNSSLNNCTKHRNGKWFFGWRRGHWITQVVVSSNAGVVCSWA